MFEVAVIIINYNSSKYTINCIKSIIEKTNPELNFQIIIIDNASEDEDFKNLKLQIETIDFLNLILVRSNINTGFGGGNMFGVQHANAKHLAFVNNDTLFINDCLGIIKKELEQNPKIGIAGAQAFSKTGDFMTSLDHFASPAREILGRYFLEFINPLKYPKRKHKYTTSLKVNFVPGSFMFVNTEDFNAVGGFDTNIFLYYEETDLCKRLANNNKDAYLVPMAKFVHYHGVSTPKHINIKKELKISLLYIIRKHYGFWAYKLVLLFLVIKYFFSSIIKPKNFSLFLLLLREAHLSESLKLRQKINNSK